MAATIGKKLCFVTVGATASFNELVEAVLSSAFLAGLERQNYTDLLIQYGNGGRASFESALISAQSSERNIKINGFELDRAGLSKYLREARGNNTSHGVVISHAGSGTVLDALRLAVPLIVVPNASLLDNHQVELAEALAEQGYVVHGQLSNLPKALVDVDTLAKWQKDWPPVNSGKHRDSRGLTGVLDEEMGFLD